MTLSPLETLFEIEHGSEIPLPEALKDLYGWLQFPSIIGRPYVFSNFVSTLDGVVSLGEPGYMNPGEISGYNTHDRMVMGLLRAVSDAVIAGASALRAAPGHVWSPYFIFPDLAQEFRSLRASLGLPEQPLNVILTARGTLDLTLPLFQTGGVPVLILTTDPGAERLRAQLIPPGIELVTFPTAGLLNAGEILEAVQAAGPARRVLMEGGPTLHARFLAEHLLDELFLTLAPQIAGREVGSPRPGLVDGRIFAPVEPKWGSLVSVKRAGDHLFTRYAFRGNA
jgi:riboflavin biosynthesis pyrimidine reductase